ncbi:MAG: mechanosensitive ion channel, partial [Candidatus Omnitrophota bacterium]
PVIAAVIIFVGGRDIIANTLAGRLLLNEYKRGDAIEFDSISGQIISIDCTTTKIKSKDNGLIIVPNSELTKKIIKKTKG